MPNTSPICQYHGYPVTRESPNSFGCSDDSAVYWLNLFHNHRETDMSSFNEHAPNLTARRPLKPASSQVFLHGFALVVASIALLGGCVANAESPTEVLLEIDFQLQVGQSAHVAEANLMVGFQGVSSDSRCARGENCFWEGDAIVRIWLQKTGGAKDEFELHTSSRSQNVAVYKGFSVRLVAVHPAPVSGVEIIAANYVTTFQVTPGNVGGDYIL
jgi:hypothetical protein